MKTSYFKNDVILIDVTPHNKHIHMVWKDVRKTYIGYNINESLQLFKNYIKGL